MLSYLTVEIKNNAVICAEIIYKIVIMVYASLNEVH